VIDLGSHSCNAWCSGDIHKTLTYELVNMPGRSWDRAYLVGRQCIVQGVDAVVLAMEPAPEAPPYYPDSAAIPHLVTWQSIESREVGSGH
jgi:hypothetical protein